MKTNLIDTKHMQWELVWSDEFDYEGLPSVDKWGYEEGCFLKNNEEQFYKCACLKNSRVENGTLIIEAHKEKTLNPLYNKTNKSESARNRKFADYTSASLITKHKASWKYGRIEARAKVPSGRGTWPAFWMLGANINSVGWPACGEIDIMEYVGYQPTLIHGTVHTENNNIKKNKGIGGKLTLPSASSEFHIYAIEWEETEIRFYVDQFNYHTVTKKASTTNEWPFDQDFFLIINLAIGGDWGGIEGIDNSNFPCRYVIDYVRVYKSKPLNL